MKTFSVLVIGLGSMGKRRIRNLKALGVENITGFDARTDRVSEVTDLYQIPCFANWNEALSKSNATAWIISVPPKAHCFYMNLALTQSIPFFVEASVVDSGMKELIQLQSIKNTVAAPSCTLCFHPAIKIINECISSQRLGKISNVLYQMGNYLPDWHRYEKVSDFYVSDKETGGAREIVPFELTWLTRIFGFPENCIATVKKTIEIEGAPDIDDTYNCLLDYSSFTLLLTVDVVSRFATRFLRIIASDGQLEWDWNKNAVRIFNPQSETWEEIPYEIKSSASGYNKNITEQMYIEELKAFMDSVTQGIPFPNSLEEDHQVLNLLYQLETSAQERRFLKLK